MLKLKNILVNGVGSFGIGIYKSEVNNEATKEYDTWSKMLQRCYNEKYREKYPTYKDCTVIKKWLNFQIFAKWFEENYVEGWQLDKDILLKGNKIYSPETCCFVPSEVNNLLLKSGKIRGEYPIGVSKRNKNFISQLKCGGKKVHLGMFSTPEEAFQAYKKAKEFYIKQIAEKYKIQITRECYEALINYKIEITD